MYSCVQLCPSFCNPLDSSPLCMGYFRQEYCSGFPPPADLPDPGTEPASPVLRLILYCWSYWEASSQSRHYSVERSFRLKKKKKLSMTFTENLLCATTHCGPKQLDYQLFLQKKKKGKVYLGISKELQSRLCSHGSHKQVPQRKMKRRTFL